MHWNLRSLDGLPALAHAHVADAVPRTGEDARACDVEGCALPYGAA